MIDVMVYVVLLAELACEGQAGEMLQPVPVNGVNVKPNYEGRKEARVGEQRDNDEHTFTVFVEGPEGDIGQDGKGEQQAAEETEYVGDVVDPWQQATQEEEKDDAKELQKGFPWLLQHLPTLKQLHKQAGEKTKLRACWTHLQREERAKVTQHPIIHPQITTKERKSVWFLEPRDECVRSKLIHAFIVASDLQLLLARSEKTVECKIGDKCV